MGPQHLAHFPCDWTQLYLTVSMACRHGTALWLGQYGPTVSAPRPILCWWSCCRLLDIRHQTQPLHPNHLETSFDNSYRTSLPAVTRFRGRALCTAPHCTMAFASLLFYFYSMEYGYHSTGVHVLWSVSFIHFAPPRHWAKSGDGQPCL